MRYSKYNITIKNNQNVIFYNTLNNSVVELSHTEFKQLKKDIKNGQATPVINEMEKQGMLIQKDDELDILKYNYKCMQFDKLNFSLTICPTMDCIFRCPYCFESRKKGKMSVTNQEKLINFVKNNIQNYKNMDVLWFGGEPLMAFDVIENLSKNFIEICKENDIPYHAYIISNAYLIDNNIAKKFVEYKIDGIQITIDGPKNIHDQRRVLVGNIGTYDRIVSNIKILENYNIRVNIRINIDKTNLNAIPELFDDFEKKGLHNVKFDFGHVLSYTDNCNAIACNCLSKLNFSKTIMYLNDLLAKYSFKRNKQQNLPEPITVYCDSQKKYSYNIDHELNMYKCWNEMGDTTKSIGKLNNEERTEEQRANERKYMLWNPFETKKCTKCPYLPLCMGGCPFMGIKIGKKQCDKWKYIIPYMLKGFVAQYE